MCLAAFRPPVRHVAIPMEEIENRILLTLRISRRRVNEIIALVTDHTGTIEVMMNRPVRHTLNLPSLCRLARHHNHVVVPNQVRLDQWVIRVEERDPVDIESIAVDIRLQSRGSQRPHALRILHHRHSIRTLQAKLHNLSPGHLQTESNRSIGVNLGRQDLSNSGNSSGHETEHTHNESHHRRKYVSDPPRKTY